MRVSKVLGFFLFEQGEISTFRADYGKNQQVKTLYLPKKVDSSEGKREMSCMKYWVVSMNTFTTSHLLFPSTFVYET